MTSHTSHALVTELSLDDEEATVGGSLIPPDHIPYLSPRIPFDPPFRPRPTPTFPVIDAAVA